ncbi:MAG: FAD-dependent oxidoreductase [Dehalococcoidales bacterium]|nr:FAD-dependent oxidoreductase [Dehalococcoidales bacterium]
MVSNMSTDSTIKDGPRILVVGGIAGGASCAARARRLMEKAEIIIFERGPHVSFASCGLPYFIGDIIKDENDLMVATPELFKKRLNIKVKLRHEVMSIDRAKQEIMVKDLSGGELSAEKYDALVLSPGSSPVLPDIPGIDSPGIFTLRTLEDSHKIKQWIEHKKVHRAAVVGAGFIGLETAENLAKSGIRVTIIEQLSQVMPNLDREIAFFVHEQLAANQVELLSGESVTGFESKSPNGLVRVYTKSGKSLDFEMVLLSAGVRPKTDLAVKAGLEMGKMGGIRVDEHMRTSDQKIWAVGDAVEVQNQLTHEWAFFPMAGPASRQGRIAADVIAGRNSSFRGVQGTIVCKIFGITVASTGLNEKTLTGLSGKMPYEKVYLHPEHHADYYPDAREMHMKLLFTLPEGKILGFQAAGEEGIERRVDVVSMAIQKGATVYDLEEAEMCYAPQFGSAKDPVNLAGMVAANVLRGDSQVQHWQDNHQASNFILDVRDPVELQQGHYEGAVNIPLPELRGRLNEIPAEKEIMVYCAVGKRSYFAERILKQNGFRVKSVSGGMSSYHSLE